MSLGIVIKGPEGVVLAADSRVTLTAEAPDIPTIQVNFDNVTKLLSFNKPHEFVGVVTYGQAVIGLRTAHSYIPEFELNLKSKKNKRLSIKAYADELSKFYLERWEKETKKGPKETKNPPDGSDMMFIVAGYNAGDPYGSVFLFGIPNKPKPREQSTKEKFGMTWGGQLQIASRIIHGFDPIVMNIIREKLNLNDESFDMIRKELVKLQWQIPWQILPLQDCIDLAINVIRITMAMQGVGITVRGVGGIIEIATITRTGKIKYVQKKRIHGEFAKDFYEGT